MTEKNIDLSNAMPYLMKLREFDVVWQTLDFRVKDFACELKLRVNFTNLEMFILSHKV